MRCSRCENEQPFRLAHIVKCSDRIFMWMCSRCGNTERGKVRIRRPEEKGMMDEKKEDMPVVSKDSRKKPLDRSHGNTDAP